MNILLLYKSLHESNNLFSISSIYQDAVSKNPVISQIAKVSYRDFFVGIYSPNLAETNSLRHFFFEPIFLLDTTSITSGTHGLLKPDYVKFAIQMWNPELRSKVLERVRSLPDPFGSVGIQEDDIYVMPYEEVQLVFKADSFLPSIKLMDQPTTYLRSRENLDFYLLCDTPSTSNVLAEDFSRNPSFTLNTWQLALECRGLALGNGTESEGMASLNERPTFTFYVTVPTDDGPHRHASQNS